MRATADTESPEAHRLPGLDLNRLGAWLSSAVPDVGDTLTAQLLAGGKSNLTCRVTDGAQAWIVRRPPVGKVLATAHDMAREYRVMAALQHTDVPVPSLYGFCEDVDVLGAPFYVMEVVPGQTYRYAADIRPLGPERTRAISGSLIDVLSALHRVDPVAVGLEDFGRPNGFLLRQVNLWRRQLEASRTRELPGVEELHERLTTLVPPQAAAGIVHGDFRLDNVLTDDHDRVLAVIDWELATLGDPLCDLALMIVYGRLGEVATGDQIFDIACAPGFLSEDEIVARYAAGSDRDLSHLGFYLGLASFKLAGILEGIHHRYINRQTVGDGFDHWGTYVPVLLDGGLAALQEYR